MIKLAPKEEIEKRIAEIEMLDLNTASIDDIKNLLTLLFTGYTLTTPIIPEGTLIFRGIIYKDKPKLASYVSFPPAEFAAINRASRQGDSHFYGSNSKATILYETHPAPGDLIAISEWVTMDKLLVNNVGYTASNFKALLSKRNAPELTISLSVTHLFR
ncbi:hypothetical protein [Pseudochryseolinea flava]|uniref:RES domain-containing protein n=1 Tax=Pseudochryseolinea flava TaxID=2059302 RepID=A0A364Y350_9BACT|nr:hypothetical protein [Pseudochryseolinea flava]RAW01112.1 hypothetical protein DQQ10_12855 [Pseudochryseolinea flava]